MIIIDASVANKLILSFEEGHPQAREIARKHTSHLEEIMVPDLLLYEVANTLATKSGLSYWRITNSLTKVYQMHLILYHPTEADLKEATKLAKRYHTSVYDMLYAVVAKKHKIRLITSDEQFVKQTGFSFVKLLQDI